LGPLGKTSDIRRGEMLLKKKETRDGGADQKYAGF
jgi:hypothetical protein